MIFEQQLTRSMRRGNSRLRCHAVRNCCANSMKQGHTSKHHRMKPRESNTRTPLLIVRALIKKKGSERVGWAEKPSTYFIVGRSAGLCSPAYVLHADLDFVGWPFYWSRASARRYGERVTFLFS